MRVGLLVMASSSLPVETERLMWVWRSFIKSEKIILMMSSLLSQLGLGDRKYFNRKLLYKLGICKAGIKDQSCCWLHYGKYRI